MNHVRYLEAHEILAAKRGKAPRFYSADGYGRKIPIGLMLTLSDKRKRRVYVCQISNSGMAYVLVNGDWRVIGPDAEERIETLTAS